MTVIFIGRSGSGKGTQAELLIKHLTMTDSKSVVYLETGRYVRELLKQPTYSGRLAKIVSERGERQPDFLAVYLWSNFLVNNLRGDEHLIFDGTPRSLVEAQALDTAMIFYQRAKPFVIFLDITAAGARERLTNRGRHDDDQDGIEKRLAWYERDVEPVVDYYRRHSGYRFVRIDGEQSIETIHEDIKKSVLAVEKSD